MLCADRAIADTDRTLIREGPGAEAADAVELAETGGLLGTDDHVGRELADLAGGAVELLGLGVEALGVAAA